MSRGTLDFIKWWELRRATDFPQEPPSLPIDDGASTQFEATYGGRNPQGYAVFHIAPPPYIPGQAAVEHEMGHDIQKDISDRTGAVETWIAELFAVRGAALPSVPDANTKDAAALAVEQACSMLPEAFIGQWGGYKHPLYDNINDPVSAAAQVQAYAISPAAYKVRWFFRNYRNWQPLPKVETVSLPSVVVVQPSVQPDTLRYCYDSITAHDIPEGAEFVAGYIDGLYKWSDADWALFPNSIKVRIAVLPTTNDGHVLDVEPGDATPESAVEWVKMRRAAGADPTIYCGLNQWAEVRGDFGAAGVPEPHYWVAHYDGDPTPIDGAVAKQFANPLFNGGAHYDSSVVAGRWPGVEDELTQDEFNKWFDARYSENAEQVNTTKAIKDALDELNARLDKLHDV